MKMIDKIAWALAWFIMGSALTAILINANAPSVVSQRQTFTEPKDTRSSITDSSVIYYPVPTVELSETTTVQVKTPKLHLRKVQDFYVKVTARTRVTVKSYCPCKICCGDNADGMVAWKGQSIHPTRSKFLAVSRDLEDLLPFGTEVYVPGLGVFIVADRTSASKTSQIEILVCWWVDGYSTFHQAAWYMPSFKGNLVRRGDRWEIAQYGSHEGEPLPWEKLPWRLETDTPKGGM